MGITSFQPGPCGLLAVDIAQQHGEALVRQPRREVGSQRALPTPTFAIDNGNDRHDDWLNGDWFGTKRAQSLEQKGSKVQQIRAFVV